MIYGNVAIKLNWAESKLNRNWELRGKCTAIDRFMANLCSECCFSKVIKVLWSWGNACTLMHDRFEERGILRNFDLEEIFVFITFIRVKFILENFYESFFFAVSKPIIRQFTVLEKLKLNSEISFFMEW